MKTTGQIAYEAYCGFSDNKSLVSGDPLPEWDEQAEKIRQAWDAAGDAVVDYLMRGVKAGAITKN
jgi:hypothetical protein